MLNGRKKKKKMADAISALELPCGRIKHSKSAGNAESCCRVVAHIFSVGLIELGF